MKRFFIIAAMLLPLVAGSAAARNASSTAQVVYTGEIAKKINGYNGPTPLNIHVAGGKIVKIEALDNNETPQYFQKAANHIFKQYEGKTVAEALRLTPDAATGATYSSEAIIKNIQMGLQQVKTTKAKSTSKSKKTTKKRRSRR